MSSDKWASFMKRMARNFLYSVPVTLTFLDKVGYIAKVEGISMQPALNPDHVTTNDFVLLNKWAIRNFDLQQGEIVALKCPKNPDQKLIKRIVAIEGDTVKSTEHGRYVSIPAGHCWVEGDHLSHSMDSNFFGPVAMGLIFAKASHIVWPPSRWQKLEIQLPDSQKVIPYPLGNPELPWKEDDD